MSIRIKNTAFSIYILNIETQDIELIKKHLRKKIDPAPMMFAGMKVVVDLTPLEGSPLTLDLTELKAVIEKIGLVIIAIMTESKTIRKHAVEAKLNTMRSINDYLSSAAVSEKKAEPTSTTSKSAENSESNSLKNNLLNTIISNPIRSGQRVYSQGDLTIIGQVSPGAEIIANGSIHIYGKLLGRAVAGAQGDESAKIFCQHFNAELVSIAGSYKQFSDPDSEYHQKSVQISLNDEKIVFFSL